jgi:hypothetical protein
MVVRVCDGEDKNVAPAWEVIGGLVAGSEQVTNRVWVIITSRMTAELPTFAALHASPALHSVVRYY